MTDRQYALGYDCGFRDGYQVGVEDGFGKCFDKGLREAAIEAQ